MQPSVLSNTILSRAAYRKSSSDRLVKTHAAHASYSKMSPQENRLTVAAGSADSIIMTTSPPTPPRTPLQRKDHIVKCPKPSAKRSVRRKKQIQSTSDSFGSQTGEKSTDAEATKRKRRQIRYRRIVSFIITAIVSIMFGGIGFLAFSFGNEYTLRRDELIRQRVRDEEIEPLLMQYQQQINVLLYDQKLLHEQLQRLETDRAKLMEAAERAQEEVRKNVPGVPSGSGVAQDPSHQIENQVVLHEVHGDQYAEGIRRLSRQLLLEKFGAGPYHVEMHLAFPSDATATATALEGPRTGIILLELATADEMPHTVYIFLSRVSTGLYDGCSFYHDEGHLLMVGTMADSHTPVDVDLRQRFVDAGLEKVHIQEYSEAWPHEQWTLGLAGRPGGTDFYINTQNNAISRGPGSQRQHDASSKADPCFAKVVKGFDLLERMQSLSYRSMSVPERIKIHSARIVQ